MPESVAEMAREFDRFEQAYERAEGSRGRVERTITVAGARVALSFAGPALARSIMPALDHLVGADSEPVLTVRLWDTASTDVPLPSSSLLPSKGALFTPVLDRGPFHLDLQISESILTFIDRERGRAVVAMRSADLPLWERAAPLRTLWQQWLAARGVLLVHAAAVAVPGGRGALLVGPGGSGKSTTAMLCHRAGFEVAGDDYVLLDPTARVVHTIYRSVKLDWRRRELLPEVANTEDEEKALGYLPGPARTVPIARTLRLVVGSHHPTQISDAAPAQLLRDLAPRAVLLVPGGEALFAELAAVVRSLPCHRLDLGTDPEQVVSAIEAVLVTREERAASRLRPPRGPDRAAGDPRGR